MNTSTTFQIGGFTWSAYFHIDGEVSVFRDGELYDRGIVLDDNSGEPLIHEAERTPEAVLCVFDEHWKTENAPVETWEEEVLR
jgi:hypothetical protein